MSICVNAISICRCQRGGLSRAQEWCGAGLVAPLVACGPNRTNELAAVLLWREDRRQGVRTTPARREPTELLIGICWAGGTQCQGHPSIHLTDLTKQCRCLKFRCCGILLVAESGWYQFQLLQQKILSWHFCLLSPGCCVSPLLYLGFCICICSLCSCICVFVFGFEFLFFDPWLRCVTLRRRGLARVRYLKILPSDCLTKLATLEWTKLYVLKKIVCSELIAVYHSTVPQKKQTKCDECKIWLNAIKHMNVYGARWLSCLKCPEVNWSFQKYSSRHL